jgi:hypothetical protein
LVSVTAKPLSCSHSCRLVMCLACTLLLNTLLKSPGISLACSTYGRR